LVTVENKKSEDDDVIIPQIPTTSYQHDWNTWSPGALRHPISSNLQTGKAKTKYNSQLIQKRRNHNNSLNLNKKNEVYEQQLVWLRWKVREQQCVLNEIKLNMSYVSKLWNWI